METLLAEYYRQHGYDVDHVGTGATGRKFDGGIDLKLRKGDQYILVQCKHWNVYKVAHNDVHQLLGLMVNESANGAILVTSGEFTKAAIQAATKLGHVQLIDGDVLRKMLGPLPELDVPLNPVEERSSTAGTFASKAADRLLDAAEYRIRHGSGGRRSSRSITSAATAGLTLVLIKFGLAVLLFFGGMMLLRSVIGSLNPVVSRPPAAQLPPGGGIERAPVQRPIAQGPKLIDHYTGTTIQDLPADQRPRRGTEAEIRESQRRADEAMKVIEATTPEM